MSEPVKDIPPTPPGVNAGETKASAKLDEEPDVLNFGFRDLSSNLSSTKDTAIPEAAEADTTTVKADNRELNEQLPKVVEKLTKDPKTTPAVLDSFKNLGIKYGIDFTTPQATDAAPQVVQTPSDQASEAAAPPSNVTEMNEKSAEELLQAIRISEKASEEVPEEALPLEPAKKVLAGPEAGSEADTTSERTSVISELKKEIEKDLKGEFSASRETSTTPEIQDENVYDKVERLVKENKIPCLEFGKYISILTNGLVKENANNRPGGPKIYPDKIHYLGFDKKSKTVFSLDNDIFNQLKTLVESRAKSPDKNKIEEQIGAYNQLIEHKYRQEFEEITTDDKSKKVISLWNGAGFYHSPINEIVLKDDTLVDEIIIANKSK